MKGYWFAAVLVLCAAPGFAQKAQFWAKEPTAVFGITLGAVLTNEAISECGGVKAETVAPAIAACAMARPGYGDILVAGLPVQEFEGGLIRREDDVVTGIYLHGKHSDYHQIKTVLLARYGRPSAIRSETLKNGMGATFTSELSMWNGKNVTLVLKERSGEINNTGVHFSHNATAVKNMLEREKALKDSASKM